MFENNITIYFFYIKSDWKLKNKICKYFFSEEKQLLPKSMRHQLTGSKRGGELRAGAFGERRAAGGTARGAIEQPKSHLATCCCLLGNGGDLLLPAGERRRRDAACWCGRRCTRDACLRFSRLGLGE